MTSKSSIIDSEAGIEARKALTGYVEKLAIFLLSFFVYMQSQQMDLLDERIFAMQADKVTSADLQVLRNDVRKDMDVMSANFNSKIDTTSASLNNKMDLVIKMLDNN